MNRHFVYAVQKRESSRYEGYYFMKKEGARAWIGSPYGDEDLTLHTLGGRVQGPVEDNLSLTTEWAYPFGKRGDFNQSAYGGYAYLTYNLNPEKKMNVMGGFNLLSGDDPSTDDNEGWNPIFSRWPKWSELYIYSQVMETVRGRHKVAYWTNTFSPYVKYNMNVTPNISMQACYYHLQSLQDASFWNPGAMCAATNFITKMGILVAIVDSLVLAWGLPLFFKGGTAIFFGLCASAFLPIFLGGLYLKNISKAAALWSFASGFIVSFF
ncbi:MAG: hypothetical protein U5R06_20585 [candidate division KSB1 bacterium]|nr:hypothetical protein [candidate division KSB1 bacterium]